MQVLFFKQDLVESQKDSIVCDVSMIVNKSVLIVNEFLEKHTYHLYYMQYNFIIISIQSQDNIGCFVLYIQMMCVLLVINNI